MDKLGNLSWANPDEVNMFQPKDLDKMFIAKFYERNDENFEK